jgi:hypothetical protein
VTQDRGATCLTWSTAERTDERTLGSAAVETETLAGLCFQFCGCFAPILGHSGGIRVTSKADISASAPKVVEGWGAERPLAETATV